MAKSGVVTNGGSAIGEAIGNHLEDVLQSIFSEEVKKYNCYFISQLGQLGKHPTTGKLSKKLLLRDDSGTEYNIDGLILDERLHPLVLIESKYIRYKKHNRDKGSWICHAHTAIRKRYTSIRCSIAVLAGSWSATSLKMLRNNDVSIFVIGFDHIANFLAEKGIDFYWEENDYDKALVAWKKYELLSEEDKIEIAEKMVSTIKDNLLDLLSNILSDEKPRSIKHIVVEIISSRNETKRLVFNNREDAISYLEEFSVDEIFSSASFYTIFDTPEMESE